jgi:ABC-type nitrate/sulfonate/bicarbonate transport system substrate-binding protein
MAEMNIRFNKLKRRIPITIAAVVTGLLLSLGSPVSHVFAEPLRVGAGYRSVQSTLIYVADSQGFFKTRRVDVALKEYEAGVLAANDLIADKIDIATAGDFAFVLQSFKHPDLRMLATISISSDYDLVVRKDRGIAQPQDLKGKRVAVTRGSGPEFFLYNYLIFNRIPSGSIQVVYHTPSEMVRAMADGTIDAALCWPSYTTEMEKQLGANGLRWPAQSGQDYYFVLLAKEGLLKKRSKAIEQFLTALSDAEAFVSKYPDRAQTIVRNRFKADSESFLSAWSRSRYQLQLSQDMLVLMEREAKWAIRNNLVDKKDMPNYLDFFYFEPLEKVKPDAVSIVH